MNALRRDDSDLVDEESEDWMGSTSDDSVLSDAEEDHQAIVPAALIRTGGDSMVTPEMTQQLIQAVMDNNVAEIGGLVKLIGVDVDTTTGEEGETPLAVAAFYGKTEALEKLLELGADVNHQDSRLGKTPLMKASMRGFVGIVEQLVMDHDAELEMKDNDGRTALHDAALYGEKGVIAILVREGADVDAVDSLGKTAAFHCCRLGDMETLKFLVEDMEADIHLRDTYGNTALMEASMWGAEESMLHWLIKWGKLDVNDQDNIGYFALTKATIFGHMGVVRTLISFGARVNWITNDGRTAVMCAAEWGHDDIVHALATRYDADINVADELGETALMKACSLNRIGIVDLLLSLGAQTEVYSDFGRTPLLVAASSGYVEIVRALLRKGANVAARDDSGSTSLILASENGNVETVRELVLHNADLQDTDDDGYNALARVVDSKVESNAKCTTMRTLVELGADPLASIGGESIFNFAMRRLTDTSERNTFLTLCRELAGILHHEGRYLNSVGNFAEAKRNLENACALEPFLLSCYIDRAICLLHLDERTQAEECLRLARKKKPYIDWQSWGTPSFERKQIKRLLRSDCRKLLHKFAKLASLRPGVTASVLSEEESGIRSLIIKILSNKFISNASRQDLLIASCLDGLEFLGELYRIGQEMEDAEMDERVDEYWDSTLENVMGTTVSNDHYLACFTFLTSAIPDDFLDEICNSHPSQELIASLQSDVLAELCDALLQCSIRPKGDPANDQELNVNTFTTLDDAEWRSLCNRCSLQLARLEGGYWGHSESSRGIFEQLRSICRAHTEEIVDTLSLSSASELSEFMCRGIIDAARVVVVIMLGYVGYRQNDQWSVWELLQTVHLDLEYDDYNT